MNKTRHIVAMRFCIGGLQAQYDPMSVNSIERLASLCNRFTVKSLNNMRNKSFEPVFLVHNTADLTLLGPLVPIAAELSARIVKYCDFQNFCDSFSDKDEILISRCDADDAYANWVIDDIQNYAKQTATPVVYGYGSALLHRLDTNVVRKMTKHYTNTGHWSAFQTVVYKKDSDLLRGFNPYAWKHTNLVSNEKFKAHIFNSNISLKDLIKVGDCNQNLSYPCSIWIRDGENASLEAVESDLKYPEVNISKTEIKDIYGVDLLS